jgi:methionyl-tRNA formyltransferase
MRIVFMGTPDFANPTLEILVENGYEVVAVVTGPDRPAGRGKQLKASPVKVCAEGLGIPVLQPEKLRDPEFVQALQDLKPDLAVVVAFRMLPEVVWSIPRIGTLNLHAALLPDYRGAAPINWVIINGETKTGATTFLIDKKIDTGAILLKTELDIPAEWNAGDLHDALMLSGATLVLDTVKALEAGEVTAQPQDHTAFQNPAPKIFKEDCRIDWNLGVEQIHNFVRGMSPYPTAWTTVNEKILKVFATRPLFREPQGAPGTALVEDHRLMVNCADGQIEITELQMEGKKRLATDIFMRGYKEEIDHVG